MSLHYPHVQHSADGHHATCAACKWRGEAKKSKSAALRDWYRRHPDMPRRMA